ncbi:FkbM family methyltransferase [Prochlorococcus marinus]|nr:FkbM family methyltransferase [Prochlorococcus marinus]
MGGQDVMVANMIGPALTSFKRGTYLDIGCGHERVNSNTKIFSEMGWRGVAVDMNPLGNWDQRENCKLIKSALIDKSITNRECIEAFIHPTDAFFSTTNQKTKERHLSNNEGLQFNTFITKTIDAYSLAQQTEEYLKLESNSLDFLSIDIEEGLSSNTYTTLLKKLSPRIIAVECDKNQFQSEELKTLKSFADLGERIAIIEKSWELLTAYELNYKLIHIIGYDLILISPEFSSNL